MRVYADSSFVVKLVSRGDDSDLIAAEYRRLGLPRLFYLPLHALEVENAIWQIAHFKRHSLPANRRQQIARERDYSFSVLERMLARGSFQEESADWEKVVLLARSLGRKHTEKTGARSLDLLHVAFALDLLCETFLTTDKRQAQIAKAEGLKVIVVSA